jgi:hypothetical protein
MREEDSKYLAEIALTSLRQSAHTALAQKMRLGQYAVVIEDGKVLQIGPDEIAKRLELQRTSTNRSTPVLL